MEEVKRSKLVRDLWCTTAHEKPTRQRLISITRRAVEACQEVGHEEILLHNCKIGLPFSTGQNLLFTSSNEQMAKVLIAHLSIANSILANVLQTIPQGALDKFRMPGAMKKKQKLVNKLAWHLFWIAYKFVLHYQV